MDIQDTQDKTPTPREDPMARKRALTAGEFYMDIRDVQDNGKKHKTKNRGSSTSLKRHEGNLTWMGMNGQDREQRKSFGSPWRTGTAGEFYMDIRDGQDEKGLGV
jgi:hypothetical protein